MLAANIRNWRSSTRQRAATEWSPTMSRCGVPAGAVGSWCPSSIGGTGAGRRAGAGSRGAARTEHSSGYRNRPAGSSRRRNRARPRSPRVTSAPRTTRRPRWRTARGQPRGALAAFTRCGTRCAFRNPFARSGCTDLATRTDPSRRALGRALGYRASCAFIDAGDLANESFSPPSAAEVDRSATVDATTGLRRRERSNRFRGTDDRRAARPSSARDHRGRWGLIGAFGS